MSMSEDASPHYAQQPRRFSAARTEALQSRGKPINHDSLREHEFFKDRDPKLLDMLMENIQVEIFMPGSDILTEGCDGDRMYFLYRGKVEVLVGPNQMQVAMLGSGSLFGEMALLGNGKRAATIRAVELCDCRVIGAGAFHGCLKRFPAEKMYFQRLARERLAELKKKAAGSKCESPKPPSTPTPNEAVRKFRRASHAIVACEAAKAKSEPASRTNTWPEDIMDPADQSLKTKSEPASRTNTLFDDLELIYDETAIPMKPVPPGALPSRSLSTYRRSSAMGMKLKPLSPVLGMCPRGELDNWRRQVSDDTYDRREQSKTRMSLSGGICGRSKSAETGRRLSNSRSAGPKQNASTKSGSDDQPNNIEMFMTEFSRLSESNMSREGLRKHMLRKCYQ